MMLGELQLLYFVLGAKKRLPAVILLLRLTLSRRRLTFVVEATRLRVSFTSCAEAPGFAATVTRMQRSSSAVARDRGAQGHS